LQQILKAGILRANFVILFPFSQFPEEHVVLKYTKGVARVATFFFDWKSEKYFHWIIKKAHI